MDSQSTPLTPKPQHVDVVIVGGGLNGLCCSLALSQLPITVMTLERAPAPLNPNKISDQRQLILSASSRKILEGIGAWQPLEPQTLALPHVQINAENNRTQVTCQAREAGLDYLGYVIPATHLLKSLQDQAGHLTHTHYDSALKSIRAHESGLELTISSNKKAWRCTTSLLIGCDGQRSSVRKHWNIPWQEEPFETAALVVPCFLDKPLPAVAQQRFCKGGIWACVPTLEGHATFVVTSCHSHIKRLRSLTPQDLCHEINEAWSHLPSRIIGLSDQPQFHRGDLCWAEKAVASSSVLIGNAAQVLPPIAAQGFNLGLRGVAWVVEHVIECLATGRHLGDAQLLARFQRQADKDRQLMFQSTRAITAALLKGQLRLKWLREVGLTAADTFPALRKQVTRWGLGQLSRLPALARGMPLQTLANMHGLKQLEDAET